MVRRVSPSQLRSELQRAQQLQRQAINNYNAQVRKLNRAIDNYNGAARQHNARVRANRERLRREFSRLGNSTRTTHRVTYRTSVTTVQETFRRVKTVAESPRWIDEPIDRTNAGRMQHVLLAGVNEYHLRNMGDEIKRKRLRGSADRRQVRCACRRRQRPTVAAISVTSKPPVRTSVRRSAMGPSW